MTASPDDNSADLHAVIVALRADRDAALAREAALAEALAKRNSEYGERIEHQAATIDVLKAMSASPGDPQPVFDLITRQATNQCNVPTAAVATFDGRMMHLATQSGFDAAYVTQFPRPVSLDFSMGRAVLNRRVDQVEDIAADPGHSFAPVLSPWSVIAVPILRDGQPLGAISIGRPAMGPFSASQVALLQTFAEQAVIAITSAETYRALHARTADLQETLEYQTATSDVLKVISRSTFDPQPIFDTIVSTAARLCDADDGIITTLEGDAYKLVSSFAAAPEFDAVMKGRLFPVNRGSLTGRIALEGEVIHIPDIACDPEYTQTETLTLQKNRTMLGVPLLREGGAVGTINLGRLKVEPFNERQIDLVRTFAAQAVIAIENARLITEQSEALEQQTATAEVLQVINASPGDLAPMFDAMLEKALRLCGGTIGGIFIFDGDHSVTSAVQGVTAAFQEYNDKYPMDKLQPGTVPARIIETRGPVQNPDLTAGENYHAGHPYARALVALGGIRAVLAVPLLKDGVAIGMVAIYRQEAGAFSDKQIALLQNFAAQAVIAMENARLITEQREALEQQTATAEVLQVINASPGDLVPVFNTMLDSALRLCDASFGQLITFDGVGFRAAAWQNFPPEPNRPGVTTPPAPGMALHRLIHGEEVVHVPDITADEIYRSGNPTRRRLADEFGGRTAIWVALKKDTLLLGAFVIYRTEVRPFSQKQIALLQSFAAQTVIAMENARLITEQREALKQQTATAEVLQVINRSRGDLVPVFDAILESAHSLCDIARGSLELYDGVRFHAVAVRGLSAALADKLRHGYSASDNPATRPLIEGGRLSHIRDLAETDYSITRSSVETDTARTLLCVPLRRDETLLGMIASARGEVRPFSEKEIALLENFAAQAVIAIENARLLTEQREALEQQTATAEVLQVINASPGNLAPVFEAILEKAHTLCGAVVGSLLVYDGEHFHAEATHGQPEEVSRILSRPFRPNVFLQRLVLGEHLVHIPDFKAASVREDHELTRGTRDATRIRASLWVPLRKDGVLLGCISAFRLEVRPFSEKEIALLENFAVQAVIAMDNARLITEQQEALEQQTATAEVLQAINASPGNLTPVFDTMLESALRLCGAAFGTLYTYDGERFQPVAFRGVAPGFAELMTKHPPTDRPGSPAARVLETKRPVDVPNVMDEENYRSGVPAALGVVEVGGFHAFVNVPLVKDGKVLGFFTIYRHLVGKLSDKQVTLLENFATQVVIAMESARLLNELRSRTDELAQRQAELRVTFENMGDGVAMFDETQHLVAWNRKFQDVLDVPDDIIARRQTFSEYVRYLAKRGEYGADADVEEQVGRLLDTAGQMRVFERVRPNGCVIEVRSNPVAGGGFVLIYADITERKRNEAELRAARDAAEEASRTIEAAYRELKTAQANLIQAEKMASLGQLTAGIAHEIKNPLNFVNNFAALSVDLLSELKETAAPGFAALTDDQRAEINDVSAMLTSNLEKITEHGKRADRIVKAMLEHSRGSSGERRVVDLNALIDEALNLAYHGARAQDQSFSITLERAFDEGIAPIEVNPQDMTRVFLNIFSNGFYAATRRARDGGDAGFVPTLRVTTRDYGDAAEIHVRDNGTGIAADIRDKLFQPFFTTKPTGEGTGLGLSITYDIVTQQHGGSIAVDSEVGEYTEFSIWLPRNP